MMTSGFGRNYIEVICQRLVVLHGLRPGLPRRGSEAFFYFMDCGSSGGGGCCECGGHSYEVCAALPYISSFYPQPYCCSSVLAIPQPGTPGRAILPHWPETAVSGNKRQKSENRAKAYSDSHSPICSAPSPRTPCPGRKAHGVAQSGQSVPSTLESSRWPRGSPLECLSPPRGEGATTLSANRHVGQHRSAPR